MPSELFDKFPSWIIETGIFRQLSLNQLRVLLVLCHHQCWNGSRKGQSFPGWKTIQKESGCNKSSIAPAIRKLEELHCIGVLKRGHGPHQGNIYQIFKSAPSLPDNVPDGREQLPKIQKRDSRGRIVPENPESYVPGNPERIVPGGQERNENIERDKLTRKDAPPIYTISRKVRKEYEALWGKAKTDDYMRARGYVVDPAEENASPSGEGNEGAK